MRELEIMELYLQTPGEAMIALDDERRRAEQDCTDGQFWLGLAFRYEQQGRPAQAASCRRRGEHYEIHSAPVVAVETECV